MLKSLRRERTKLTKKGSLGFHLFQLNFFCIDVLQVVVCDRYMPCNIVLFLHNVNTAFTQNTMDFRSNSSYTGVHLVRDMDAKVVLEGS